MNPKVIVTKTRNPNKVILSKLVEIWNRAYPINLYYSDVEEFYQYLEETNNKLHYLAYDEDGLIVGWLMTFERESARWFALLVDPNKHKKGIGTYLLEEVKKDEILLHGWAINHNKYQLANGKAYLSPVPFYIKNEFQIFPDRSHVNDKISAIRILWLK